MPVTAEAIREAIAEVEADAPPITDEQAQAAVVILESPKFLAASVA